MTENLHKEVNIPKRKSPFKDKEDLKKEIRDFINIHKSAVMNQASRMSDFFEMSCFNYIVKYYELNNYCVKTAGLQNGLYRYKCSPLGDQKNFSFFTLEKSVGDVNYQFEIHHNLAVQSSHSNKIFTTPDIVIIKSNGTKFTKDHYENKMTFSYVDQNSLITFCEVKQFNPFPELLFNFIGTLNELCPQILLNNGVAHQPIHLSPSLMISGVSGRHTNAIKESLESRYNINIIFNLFHGATRTFSKAMYRELKTTGPSNVKKIANGIVKEIDDYLHVALANERS